MVYILIWVLNAVALMGVAYFYPPIYVRDFKAALIAALILGLINAFLYPMLFWLTLPLSIVTLGLFSLVLNILLFWLSGSIISGFIVNSFLNATIGAFIYTIIVWILQALFRISA